MSNFRKFCATTTLLLALSLAAQAHSGWMSTGVKPTPTPETMKVTTPEGEECPAAQAATEESSYTLDLALEVSFTVLRSALALL